MLDQNNDSNDGQPKRGATRAIEANTTMTNTAATNTAGTTSMRNRRWRIAAPDPASVEGLIKAGAHAMTAPILAERGVTEDTLKEFMAPTLRALLPNPFDFLDMGVAARRLASAIMNSEKIAIWSDYDVDGATSGATLLRFLRDTGPADGLNDIDADGRVRVHIPNRITEGYGPNLDGLLALQADGFNLVFSLDSGTTAFEPIDGASAVGMEIVVIDHHAAEAQLPNALALVNPNRLDEAPGFGHLCAVGMTFLLLVATNVVLRDAGWYGREGAPKAAPDLMRYLDLVALGTVCDVVPLVGLNRAFVARGLPHLSARRSPGLTALAAKAGCAEMLDSGACGFALGPRINAGGRIGDADAGVRLLSTLDEDLAESLAEELCRLNERRQTMERTATSDALTQFEDFIPGVTRKMAIAVVDGHEGVVGISAARVKEALDAPAFVLTVAEEGMLKGSGRSVSGFDLGAAVIEARQKGLLVKGGGHAMAAGVTLTQENLPAFADFMDQKVAESAYARDGLDTRVDLVAPLARANVGLSGALDALAPFGMGNPTPKVMIPNVEVKSVRVLKDRHIKIELVDPERGEAGGSLDAIIWNVVSTPLGDALIGSEKKVIDIIGAIDVNEWNGRRRAQLRIDDARLVAHPTGK